MIADAASAGYYVSAAGRNHPRVRLPAIAGLLAGTHRPEHPDCQPDLNFKKARPGNRGGQGNLNLA